MTTLVAALLFALVSVTFGGGDLRKDETVVLPPQQSPVVIYQLPAQTSEDGTTLEAPKLVVVPPPAPAVAPPTNAKPEKFGLTTGALLMGLAIMVFGNGGG